MMRLSAGLLLMAAAQGSPWDDPAPTGRWAGSTAKLASEVLPPKMAADVVSHRVTRSIVQGGQPFSVEFEGRARATGDGFCERYRYYVHVGGLVERPGAADPPVRSTQVHFGDCANVKEPIFASLGSRPALEAKVALRWVAWAQRAAQSNKALPFRITCQTEIGSDRCGNGGRAVLANLPLEKTMIVMPVRRAPAHHWSLSVTETGPGQLYWDVKIDATPGNSSIDLTWKIPAPF